jgi:hypothetical protein
MLHFYFYRLSRLIDKSCGFPTCAPEIHMMLKPIADRAGFDQSCAAVALPFTSANQTSVTALS